MAQEINEVGTVRKMVDQKVNFTSRNLTNVYVREEHVFVEYQKNAIEGSAQKEIAIPVKSFEDAEKCIWEAVDSEINRGDNA